MPSPIRLLAPSRLSSLSSPSAAAPMLISLSSSVSRRKTLSVLTNNHNEQPLSARPPLIVAAAALSIRDRRRLLRIDRTPTLPSCPNYDAHTVASFSSTQIRCGSGRHSCLPFVLLPRDVDAASRVLRRHRFSIFLPSRAHGFSRRRSFLFLTLLSSLPSAQTQQQQSRLATAVALIFSHPHAHTNTTTTRRRGYLPPHTAPPQPLSRLFLSHLSDFLSP